MSELPLAFFRNWIASGERGLSSEAIVITLTGESWWTSLRTTSRLDHPYDPADFRRCVKLLEAVPLARLEMWRMRAVSPTWAALVDNWDQLEALALEEVPDFKGAARANGGKAPRLFSLMRQIREAPHEWITADE